MRKTLYFQNFLVILQNLTVLQKHLIHEGSLKLPTKHNTPELSRSQIKIFQIMWNIWNNRFPVAEFLSKISFLDSRLP